MNDKISITFDEENRIRVLESDKFQDTEAMKNESMEFIKKIISFDETVSSLVETLENQARKVEQEKLRAVGERNKVEGEAEARKKKMIELNSLINEKRSELERYTIEYESLLKTENEQKILIEKLSNNET